MKEVASVGGAIESATQLLHLIFPPFFLYDQEFLNYEMHQSFKKSTENNIIDTFVFTTLL